MIKTNIFCDICQANITQEQEAVGLLVKKNDAKGSILIKLELCKDHAKLITEGISTALQALGDK